MLDVNMQVHKANSKGATHLVIQATFVHMMKEKTHTQFYATFTHPSNNHM